MPYIYNRIYNYQKPYDHLNTGDNEQSLKIHKIDLYRSIITVGNPSFISIKKIKQYGLFSSLYDSILEKVALVATNIKSDKNGMRRNDIFDTYVSDKKRIISYNLGMAFAKLYAEKLLSIRDLVHVEFLKKMMRSRFHLPTAKDLNNQI